MATPYTLNPRTPPFQLKPWSNTKQPATTQNPRRQCTQRNSHALSSNIKGIATRDTHEKSPLYTMRHEMWKRKNGVAKTTIPPKSRAATPIPRWEGQNEAYRGRETPHAPPTQSVSRSIELRFLDEAPSLSIFPQSAARAQHTSKIVTHFVDSSQFSSFRGLLWGHLVDEKQSSNYVLNVQMQTVKGSRNEAIVFGVYGNWSLCLRWMFVFFSLKGLKLNFFFNYFDDWIHCGWNLHCVHGRLMKQTSIIIHSW